MIAYRLVLAALLLAGGCATNPAAQTASVSDVPVGAAVSFPSVGYAGTLLPQCPALTVAEVKKRTAEHVVDGNPAPGPVHVRRAYVMQYDEVRRVPRWVAWHYWDDYSQTPKRQGAWKTFRTDDEVSNPVKDGDYTGQGFDRGHIAPYFISGGDRDGDGMLASKADRSILDIDDACTVYEINLMSNIAPQLKSLNQSAGSWFKLESAIREISDQGADLHMFGGPVFGASPMHIGPQNDIEVPDKYFQIVVTEEGDAVAFLFPHITAPPVGASCQIGVEPVSCITTVDEIERLTGLDFFTDLPADRERAIERRKAVDVWEALTTE